MWKRIESGVSAKTLSNEYLISVKDYGLELGLVGMVFFRNDGSVKIVAEGEEEVLEEFTNELKKGNDFPIENFFTVWEKPNHQYQDFIIGKAEV